MEIKRGAFEEEIIQNDDFDENIFQGHRNKMVEHTNDTCSNIINNDTVILKVLK